MSRQGKTQRVPRTRAGETWTEAQFWGFLRSGLRQMSVRWPPRAQALKDARVPYKGPNKRRKWSYQCAVCRKMFMGSEVQVDHIDPCGSIASWLTFQLFAQRLFVEAVLWRVLCKPCHQKITNEERGIK